MYNPYSNQKQNQGPHGANLIPDHDPRMGASNMGLPFNTRASAAANPLSSLPMFSQQMSYRPEPDPTMDLQLSRDEPRHLTTPLSQPSSQMTPQRDDLYCPFTSTSTSSYSGSSSVARPPSTASNCDSSIDGSLSWLRDITRSTSAEPRSSFPSSSSSFQGGGDSFPNFVGSSDSQLKCSEGAIPGLGDYPVMETPHQQNDPPTTMYGAEMATNILRHFNLEKEDLEQLLAIPEEEITPDNLPHILRKIRMEKIRKAVAPSTSYKTPSPARPGFDSSSWADSKESKFMDYGHKDLPGSAKDISLPKQSTTIRDYSKDIPPIPNKVDLEKDKPPVLQPSKVIEYGHTGTCITGAGTESGTVGAIARAIQGIMKVNTPSTKESFQSTGTATTPPSPPKPIPSLVSTSQSKTISPTASFSSLFHSTFTPTGPESSKKPSATQGPTVVKSFPKQHTDYRLQFSKLPLQSKQATKKSGLIIVDSCKKPKSKNVEKKPQLSAAPQTNQGPLPIESCKKSRFDLSYVSSILTMPSSNVTGHPTVVPVAPIQTSNMGNLLPLTPAPIIPSSNVMWPSTVVPVAPIQTSNMGNQLPLTPASTLHSQSQDERMNCMVQDYTAACPISFPHTCSLCYTECSHMKDWISHQKSPFHFQNYTTHLKRKSHSRLSSPRSHNNSEQRDKSRSRSGSPRRHRRKERKRSRSASPPSSSCRPCSRSRSCERRESSPQRLEKCRYDDKPTSPKRQDKQRLSPRPQSRSRIRERSVSSPRRRDSTQTSPKRKEEQGSPRYRLASPPSFSRRPRSRSRSPERCKRTSPKRKDELRQFPRSKDRYLSPYRNYFRHRSRVSPRRNRERRYSPERYSPSRYTPPSRSPSRSSITPPRGHDQWERGEREERRSLSRSSRETVSSSDKRSADKTTGKRKKQSELEKATKKILDKTSVLTALSSSADMDSLVETMMPLLLSRLAKEMGTSAAPSTAAKKKVVKKSVSKPTVVKSLTMVRLGSIIPLLSHDDVVAFAEQFGKTKSVLLFRQRHQAVVCFEKGEDANKLRNATDLQIKEHSVTIVKFKEAFSMIKKKSAVSAVKRPLKSAAKMTTGKTSALETAPCEPTTSKTTTSKAAKSTIKLDTSEVTPKEPMEVEPVTPQLMKEEPVPLKPIPSLRSCVESVGETLDTLLTLNSIKSKVVCHSNVNHQFFEEDRKWLVLLTDLPEYDSMLPYTEEELVDRLKPFQFQDEPNNLYVLPQCRMAFVTMPNSEATHGLVMNYPKEFDSHTIFRGPAFVLKQGLSIHETPVTFALPELT